MRTATVVLAFAFLVTAASPFRAAQIPSGKVTRSDVCGECHRDIYRMWGASAHARSMSSPVFLHALQQAVSAEGTEVSAICLRCHSPLAAEARDTRLERQKSWEGVGCDACHTVASVDTNGANPRLRFDPGGPKRGPIRDAESAAHLTEYSQLHTSALLCAACSGGSASPPST